MMCFMGSFQVVSLCPGKQAYFQNLASNSITLGPISCVNVVFDRKKTMSSCILVNLKLML